MRKTKAKNSTDFVSYSKRLFRLASAPFQCHRMDGSQGSALCCLSRPQDSNKERGKGKAYAKKGKKKIRTFK